MSKQATMKIDKALLDDIETIAKYHNHSAQAHLREYAANELARIERLQRQNAVNRVAASQALEGANTIAELDPQSAKIQQDWVDGKIRIEEYSAKTDERIDAMIREARNR